MNAFFLDGVLFVRAASRILSVLITKTTVTFSFFSRSVAVQSIMDVRFRLCLFLVILVIVANAIVIKEPGMCIFKNLAFIFPIGRLQSMLIFSIFNHPRTFLVYYHFFIVFLSYKMNIMWFP